MKKTDYDFRFPFHKCASAMLRAPGRIAPWIGKEIILSHKFALPDAGQMTQGTPLDELKEILRLPYDRISLFREIELDGNTVSQVILAVAAPIADLANWNHCEFVLTDVVSVDRENWAPVSPAGVQFVSSGGVQPIFDRAVEREAAAYGYASTEIFGLDRDGWGALNGLSELLLLLSLSNVTSEMIDPPVKLNAKRLAQNALPLYSYSTLLIDGKRVLGRHGDSAESDRTIRSHFRRGHIRRLADGRRVWVRRAFVHGKSDGFVDKDYIAKPVDELAPLSRG